MLTILDPTDERTPPTRQVTPRTGKVAGNVAFLDISKPKGNLLLDRLQSLLEASAPRVRINRYVKPTFAKPAPAELRAKIAGENDFIVEALAD